MYAYAADTEIELSVTDKENKTSTAKITKQRDLEGGGVFGIKLVSVNLGTNNRGKPVTSCVVEHVQPESKESGKSKEESDRQKVLNAFTGKPTLVREDAKARSGISGGRFSEAWGYLLRTEEIVKAGKTVPTKPRERAVELFARKERTEGHT